MKLFQRSKKRTPAEDKKTHRSILFIDRNTKKKRRRQSVLLKIFTGQKIFAGFTAISFVAGIFLITLYLRNGKVNSIINPVPYGITVSALTDNKESEIKTELQKKAIEYTGIYKYRDSYLIILKDNKEVLVAENKSITQQIASLQFILNRLTMEGRKFKRLDLRFDKPVITL